MCAPEICILSSSTDPARVPHGRTVIELSQSTASVTHFREPSRTDPCSSRTRPAWLMLGLRPGMSGTFSTMVPLVQHGLPGLRRTQGLRCECSEPSRAASVGDR
jgi:hypothetical protein